MELICEGSDWGKGLGIINNNGYLHTQNKHIHTAVLLGNQREKQNGHKILS